MAKGRDRPRKEPKRKKAAKQAPAPPGSIAPTYQPPMRQVEVIKPKRKERAPDSQDPNSQDPNSQDQG